MTEPPEPAADRRPSRVEDMPPALPGGQLPDDAPAEAVLLPSRTPALAADAATVRLRGAGPVAYLVLVVLTAGFAGGGMWALVRRGPGYDPSYRHALAALLFALAAVVAIGLVSTVVRTRSTLGLDATNLVYVRCGLLGTTRRSIARAQLRRVELGSVGVGFGVSRTSRLVMELVGDDHTTLAVWRLPAAGIYVNAAARTVGTFLERHGVHVSTG